MQSLKQLCIAGFQDIILDAMQETSDVNYVRVLYEFVQEQDSRLVMRCGKRRLSTAVFLASRHGWTIHYGEHLARHRRFNQLLIIFSKYNYNVLSYYIVTKVAYHCTSFDVCYKLFKHFKMCRHFQTFTRNMMKNLDYDLLTCAATSALWSLTQEKVL